MDDQYDAIVVGSGIGGLTTAAVLAKGFGKRVLVLERHWVVGGQTHAFRRRSGFEWDVGLHYVGRMEPGHEARAAMDYITDGRVDWVRQAGGVDCFHFPGLMLRSGENHEQFRAELLRRFPHEQRGIERYFADLARAVQAARRVMSTALMPRLLGGVVRRWMRWRHCDLMGTTGEWMVRHIADPALRGVLTAMWGDYGLPPETSAFLMHAVVVESYRDGAWYPDGGSRRLAEAMRAVIEAVGGRVQGQTAVERILVERGRAVGVEGVRFRRSGNVLQRWYAPAVFSDVGAHGTYHRLLAHLPLEAERAETQRLMVAASSALTLYIGLRDDPAQLGFSAENHWLSRMPADAGGEEDVHELMQGRVQRGFLSFPSKKNPQARAHTAEVVVTVPWKPFARWSGQPWRKRDAEYRALKARLSEGILDLVEAHFPGFRDLVAYHELSTPLTQEFFTGHPHGAFYGLPATPQRFNSSVVGPRTPVAGCYLTGTDAASLGIVGAMMGGVMAASSSLGMRGFPQVMGKIKEEAREKTPMP